MLRGSQLLCGISTLCLQLSSQLKVKSDFVNENPKLEEFYANITTVDHDNPRARSPAWVDEPADNTSQSTREEANASSRNSPLSWIPECEAVVDHAGTAARGQSDEREANTAGTSRLKLAKCTPTPGGDHTPLDNSINPLSWISHAGDMSSNELHGVQNEPQIPLSIHSDYWPSMSVQEAYLMRHFIDDLGSWVRVSSWYWNDMLILLPRGVVWYVRPGTTFYDDCSTESKPLPSPNVCDLCSICQTSF